MIIIIMVVLMARGPRREHKNNRLWFKCNLKLGHLMFEVGDLGRLQRIIKELLRQALARDGSKEMDGWVGVGGVGGGVVHSSSQTRCVSYLIAHNNAIRPCHTSQSIPLALNVCV